MLDHEDRDLGCIELLARAIQSDLEVAAGGDGLGNHAVTAAVAEIVLRVVCDCFALPARKALAAARSGEISCGDLMLQLRDAADECISTAAFEAFESANLVAALPDGVAAKIATAVEKVLLPSLRTVEEGVVASYRRRGLPANYDGGDSISEDLLDAMLSEEDRLYHYKEETWPRRRWRSAEISEETPHDDDEECEDVDVKDYEEMRRWYYEQRTAENG